MAEDKQSKGTHRRTVVSSLQPCSPQPTVHRPPFNAFSACILAGGASRRMGQDKALIRIHGESLLQRQLRMLQQLQPIDCFISGQGGVDYGIEEIPVLLDGQPGQGPMGGIATALSACQTPLLLVLAVDMVQMTPDWLHKLMQTCPETCGRAARIDGRWEPLAAVYPKNLLPRIQQHLSKGQFSLQKLLDEAQAKDLFEPVTVSLEEKKLFTNLNTPEALDHFMHPS